jgi:dipeptidyl aminopeptidase/acylaminoacyl peptidase
MRRASLLRRGKALKIVLGALAGCVTLMVVGVVGVIALGWWAAPNSYPEQEQDYAQAREQFKTKLTRQGPSPQSHHEEIPPWAVTAVPFQSGSLRLKAWISNSDVPDGVRKPAVLFLHGGFAFGQDDWDMTKPFRDAGFVVMTPMLRGENGMPGTYSMFYDEVDDVLAAADLLAKMSYVDPDRIYLSGHSAGGTLTLLAAMTSNRFRAAAAFSGAPDMKAFVRFNQDWVPFDQSNPREFEMRSALAFPKSFQCPVRIYYGSSEFGFRGASDRTAQLARAAGKDVEAISVPGDHFSAVPEATRQAIAFFKSK